MLRDQKAIRGDNRGCSRVPGPTILRAQCTIQTPTSMPTVHENSTASSHPVSSTAGRKYRCATILKVRTYKKGGSLASRLFPSPHTPNREISTANLPKNTSHPFRCNGFRTKTPGVYTSITGTPPHRINNFPTKTTGPPKAFQNDPAQPVFACRPRKRGGTCKAPTHRGTMPETSVAFLCGLCAICGERRFPCSMGGKTRGHRIV